MAPPPALEAKRPPAWASWTYHGILRAGDAAADRHVWSYKRVLVISTVASMHWRGEARWQWLVSISVTDGRGQRTRGTDAEIARALEHFGMRDAEEDNHTPGIARMFFRHCDAAPGEVSSCECKETEEVVQDPDGFAWSKDRGEDTEATRIAEEARRRALRLGF
jgi:hypothetical protein